MEFEFIAGAFCGLLLIIIAVLLVKYYNMKDRYENRIENMERDSRRNAEDYKALNHRCTDNYEKYLFLVKQLTANPGRIIDLIGAIQGTSENPEGPIDWVVSETMKSETFRAVCNDFKTYTPKEDIES